MWTVKALAWGKEQLEQVGVQAAHNQGQPLNSRKPIYQFLFKKIFLNILLNTPLYA